MKTVIEMAHETLERMKADEHCREQYWSATDDELQAFAELVRADEREAIIQEIPGGYSVDPQWVCDMIRARSNT